ncbi:MAG: threonine/serine dehydratase [Pseudomonadota bacterium]
MTITRDDINESRQRIGPHVRVTPVMDVEAGALGDHPALNLKLEFTQKSGSFKARGAFNTLLSKTVPAAGVAAASGGNHGAAVALAAADLGIPARIFVPEIASAAKIARIEATGATIMVEGARYADALAHCEAFVDQTGAMGIHAYDAPETLAGQGTLAAEWLEQAPALDTLIVSVGGGGLIGGIGAWVRRSKRLVAVESGGTPALHEALEAGRPVDVEVSGIAGDSLGARRIGALPFETLKGCDLVSVLVDDAAIREAQKVLWDQLRLPSEPGTAAALAALLSGRYRPARDERMGILLCGANGAVADFS